MKKKFIISDLQNNFFKKNRSSFNPYILNKDIKSKKFIIPNFIHKKKTEIYLEKKFKKYKKSIFSFLNEIHGSKFDKQISNKVLSESFFKTIVIMFSVFKEFENLKEKKHDAHVIINKIKIETDFFSSFKTKILENDIFKEKLFNIYLNTFKIKFKKIKINKPLTYPINKEKIKESFLEKFIYLINNKVLLNFIISYLKKKFFYTDAKIIIFKSYFSLKNRVLLNCQSKNKIITDNFPDYIDNNKKFKNYRPIIKKYFKINDNFDKFFFNVLTVFFPKLYLENYTDNFNNIAKFLKNYKSLKYIINESFLDNDYDAFCLAVSKKILKTKHIYNEHNNISYIFIGNRIKFICKSVDYMFTLGWKSKEFPNALKGASLFNFSSKFWSKRKYSIVYFSHVSQKADFSLRWFLSGNNGFKYYLNMQKFFSVIPKHILKKIYHKPHPQTQIDGVNIFPRNFIKEIKSMKEIKKDEKINKIISMSNFCLVDYFSTTFLRTLSANKPTLCIFHKDIQKLSKKQNIKFLKPLIDNNIIFSDLDKAALFFCKNFQNPEKWWFSDKVQKARHHFLSRNLGNEKYIIDKLIKLSVN